jgi:hypothetical protein
MSKFTPGPWTAVGAIVLSPDTCGEVGCCGIAECFHGSQPEIAEANAQLIAAAPELLEFAELYVEAWKAGEVSDKGLLKVAEQCIAKATGGQ